MSCASWDQLADAVLTHDADAQHEAWTVDDALDAYVEDIRRQDHRDEDKEWRQTA